jgi:hypothetical protein
MHVRPTRKRMSRGGHLDDVVGLSGKSGWTFVKIDRRSHRRHILLLLVVVVFVCYNTGIHSVVDAFFAVTDYGQRLRPHRPSSSSSPPPKGSAVMTTSFPSALSRLSFSASLMMEDKNQDPALASAVSTSTIQSEAAAAASNLQQLDHNNNRRNKENGVGWLNKGILLSSFTDGLRTNEAAQNFLFGSLVENLWREEQSIVQDSLETSVRASPCNGPDPILWQYLEVIDQEINDLYTSTGCPIVKQHRQEQQQGHDDGSTISAEETHTEMTSTTEATIPASSSSSSSSSSSWRRSWDRLNTLRRERLRTSGPSLKSSLSSSTLSSPSSPSVVVEIRVLYIPTAMYALRADSTSTPGKQRQRARADGRDRRNAMVDLLRQGLTEVRPLSFSSSSSSSSSINNTNTDKVAVQDDDSVYMEVDLAPPTVLAVTLDFDDGSVKQLEGSDDATKFPKVRRSVQYNAMQY